MELNKDNITKVLNAAGIEGVAIEIPKNASEADIDKLLNDAIHEMGLCPCQEDGVPKVRELRNPSHNKLRASLSEKVGDLEDRIQQLITFRNGIIEAIEVLDQDPDPEDKAASAKHQIEITLSMVKMLSSLAKLSA